MYSTGPDEAARSRIGLVEKSTPKNIRTRFRVALEIILAILFLFSVYSWSLERDIADQEEARAEVAEHRLANCIGCAQSWAEYKDNNNHRSK